MKLKKVYVILVALHEQRFDHYYMEPQIFYDSREEAQIHMNRLIKTYVFNHSQLKIQELWKVPKEPCS